MNSNFQLTLFATFSALLLAGGTSADAALTVSLHPDGEGGTNVRVFGSGTTTEAGSQLTTTTLGEQWANLTGNPFDDTIDVNNAVFMFTNPIQIAAGVRMVGIEIDNDPATPPAVDGADDFRIFIDNAMSTSTPYTANGVTTLQTFLRNDALAPGSYFDDADGGTLFLDGFTLQISDDVLTVPEPSISIVLLSSFVLLALRRSRI
jgi:hypothetical protein